MSKETNNLDQEYLKPTRGNFVDEETGDFFMVRCPKCKLENWLPAVATGICAHCGWKPKRLTPSEGNDK